MALVVKDRVKVTTNTTGTGTLTLGSAVTKFQDFSVIGDGNTTYYAIESGNGTDWEVGIGTYTASGTTLSRDTILESSNAGSAINLSGTSTVFCTYPAERSVNTADIGTTVQGYDADTAKYDDTTANFTGTLQNGGSNVVVDSDIGSTVQAYDADTTKNDVANTFTANQTINGNLTVDTDTLYVNSTNNNVGIGTSSPTSGIPLTILSNSGNAIAMNVRGRADGIGVVRFADNADAENGRIDFRTNYADIRLVRNAPLVLSTNNTERMRITSGGNVGIGTSSPGSPLSVHYSNNTANPQLDVDVGLVVANLGTSLTASLKLGSVNGSLLWGNGTPGGYLTFRDRNTSTERMRIDGSGNVGIGTSSPAVKLDVRTTAGTSAQMNLYSGNNTTATKINLAQVGAIDWDIGLTATTGNFLIGGLGGSMAEAYRINRIGTAVDYHAWSTSGSERMRITSDGNVGIGTNSPLVPLHVESTGTSTSAFGNVVATFRSQAAGRDTSIQFSDGSLGGNIGALSGNLVLGNGGNERMRIDTNGNVGIGTSSPAVKLQVNSSGGTIANFVGNNANNYIQISDNNGTNFVTYGSIAGGNAYMYSTGYNAFYAGGGTERMRITSGGDVGIGTSSPDALLTVNTIASFGDGAVGTPSIAHKGDLNTGMWFPAADTIAFSEGGVEAMRITSDGEVYIAGTTDQGAYNLQCNGTGVWGAGAYVNGSDERIKENIVSLDSGLDVVAKLNPVTYTYKQEWSKDQSIQTGFIAQDLLIALEGKNYVDGIVQQGGEYMSVAYQNIIPILTKAIQEQQETIKALEARIQTLENK